MLESRGRVNEHAGVDGEYRRGDTAANRECARDD